MIQEFSNKLLTELQSSVQAIAMEDHRPQVILREQSLLIAEALVLLGRFRNDHRFGDLQQEVCYHKSIFPHFHALLVYSRQRCTMNLSLPLAGGKKKRKYYINELERIAAFFNKYRFYYDYYFFDGAGLDDVLYTSLDPHHVLQPDLEGCESSNGTVMGHLAGMFLAFERLQREVLGLLYELDGRPALSRTLVSEEGVLAKRFEWTGEVIHLIELAHGIFLTRQVNGGEIGIVELFKIIGDFFGVNLRVPKRGFDDLKSRKTMSKTQFTDMMRDVLLKKMDEDDAFDPERKLRKNGFF